MVDIETRCPVVDALRFFARSRRSRMVSLMRTESVCCCGFGLITLTATACCVLVCG